MLEALKEKGYKWDGTLLHSVAKSGDEEQSLGHNLTGAYALEMLKTGAVLTANTELIRQHCDMTVQVMIANEQQVMEASERVGIPVSFQCLEDAPMKLHFGAHAYRSSNARP